VVGVESVALLQLSDGEYSGRLSKMPIELDAVTLLTASAGVTPIVTSRPARALKPTKPNRAPSTDVGLFFWADIGSG
jgi:hypothetical protein